MDIYKERTLKKYNISLLILVLGLLISFIYGKLVITLSLLLLLSLYLDYLVTFKNIAFKGSKYGRGITGLTYSDSKFLTFFLASLFTFLSISLGILVFIMLRK